MAILLLAPGSAPAQGVTPPGTVITNVASGAFTIGGGSPVSVTSNTHRLTTGGARTASTTELLRYSPGAPGASPESFPAGDCSTSGLPGGPFVPLPPPATVGGGAIPTPGPIDVLIAARYPVGDALLLRVVDPDQDGSAVTVDSLLLRLTASTGDSELVRLFETGPSTGIFTGFVQSTSGGAAANDCALQVLPNEDVRADYVDPSDPTDLSSAVAQISPESLALDASTGSPLSGVVVTIVDDATGLPAPALGDDGVSSFPSTVTTGGIATDSGGRVYVFSPGGYRFPNVPPGTYRILVTPPASHLHPSAASTTSIQSLPGAPFSIVVGSRGEPFSVAFTGPVDIDLPLDPVSAQLFLSKTTPREVVGLGDFVQYDVRVRNPGTATAPLGLTVTDVLPPGFRFQPGSAKIDSLPVPDPLIASDGRTMTFTLGAVALPQNQHIGYVVQVTAGTAIGAAPNRAVSQVVGGAESHAATATVVVRDDLYSSGSFVVGRVVVGSCDAEVTNDLEALAGVRIYLEDGTYTTTDSEGRFHFEGLQPGNHVVQMDVATLPEAYEPAACEKNTRFAGRPFSQFVDLQAGTVWRSDFHVALRPRPKGYVDIELESHASGSDVDYLLQLNGAGVPADGVRAIVQLPDGVGYVPGSSTLDGTPISDPTSTEGALTYRLGDLSGGWSRDVGFRVRMPDDRPADRLETRAVALFDTPTRRAVATPPVVNRLEQESRAASRVEEVMITGHRPGESSDPQATATPVGEAETPVYDRAWLDTASPELEWLVPARGFAPTIPSIHIRIKHAAADRITLYQNGAPVSVLNVEGRVRSSSGHAALSLWRGVDLVEGPNHFRVVADGPDGARRGEIEYRIHYSGPPVTVEHVPELSNPVADGQTPPVIAVRLRDRFGQPVREGVVGVLEVEPPHESWEAYQALQSRPLAGLEPEHPTYRVGPGGVALVKLRPTPDSGSVVVRLGLNDGEQGEVRAWLEPESREWVLVGLFESTLGFGNIGGNEEAAEAVGLEESLGLDDRLALFARGRVPGDWRLTLAYDSRGAKDPLRESLRRVIEPDRYYTLYGSTAEQGYAAATSNKLYARIERERFYAMYGDYNAGLTSSELARYDRSFTGLKSEYEGEHFGWTAFATETDQGFVRDEIRGDGTSGLYRLSRSDLVRNSEQVTIETRDRFRSELILVSEPQTRHLDYTIDYDAGTLFFKKPIPSRSPTLDPVFVVVEYESEDDEDEAIIAGGRGSLRLLDGRMELGTSAIHEGVRGRDGDLVGVDFRYDLRPTTRLSAEFARSDASDGVAARRGSGLVAELSSRTGRLDARAYFRDETVDFGLGHQNLSELGMRKFGADARFRASDRVSLDAEIYRHTNLDTNSDRDVLQTRAEYRNGSRLLFGGFRLSREMRPTEPDLISQHVVAGGSYSTLRDRILLRLDSELPIGARQENPDFPGRVVLGGDFRLDSRLTAFAEQEFAFGDELISHGTRLGLRSAPWKGGQVSTSLEQRMAENGARTFANLGLSQTWQLSDRWALDAALDRTQTIRRPDLAAFNPDVPLPSGSRDDDFTALSLGSTRRGDRWSWTTRVETRYGERADKWGLFMGVLHELSDGIGVSVSLHYDDVDSEEGADTSSADLRSAFVYRPPASRWLFLDRLDLAIDRERSGSFQFRNRKVVNNLGANFRWNRRTQLSLHHGAKYVLDTVEGDAYRGYTDLVGIEVRRDLGERWDVGLAGRLRTSWNAGIRDASYGISLGYQVARNLWLSAGYNFRGFHDDEFSRSGYTAEGPFLRLRFKFDQETVREILEREW